MNIPDGDQLIARWVELGKPEIEIGRGVSTGNLANYVHFYNQFEPDKMDLDEWLPKIREVLGLPQVSCYVPSTDE